MTERQRPQDSRSRRRVHAGRVTAVLAACLAAGLTWWLVRPAQPLPAPAEFLWPVTVSTYAGGPTAGAANGPPTAARFSDPFGLAIDTEGYTYVADAGDNHAIRRIDPAGIVTTLAGGAAGFADGGPREARFRTPSGLAFDPAGRLIVADTGNHAVRAVTLDGQVTTLAGNGTPGPEDGPGAGARFDGPLGVAVAADGTVLVADTYNDRLRRIDPDGRVTTIAGRLATGHRDGPAAAALFDTPTGVAVCPDGTIVVADTGNDVVRRVGPDGRVTTVETMLPFDVGAGPGRLYRPVGVACGPGGHLYVTDASRVVLVTRDGRAHLLAGGRAGFANGLGPVARFRTPAGITVAHGGDLRVADAENAQVRQLTPVGRPVPARDIDLTPVPWLRRPLPGTISLAWPIDPQHGWHEVTATLGEARGSDGGDGRERLHTGVDVRAAVGAVVRAVCDGEVRRPIAASRYEGLDEMIRIGSASYVHVRVGRRGKDAILDPARYAVARGPDGEAVRIRVRRGTRFRTGDPIGTVNREAHVHLDVGPPGAEQNALMRGLPNFTDRIRPTIPPGGVTLLNESGSPLTVKRAGRLVVSGRVSVVVEAFDRVDGNAARRRLGVYAAGWQVLDEARRPAPGFETPRTTIEFDRLPGHPDAPQVVYAEGSGITVYGSPVTRFRYNVTNTVRGGEVTAGTWDTRAHPPGNYMLRVFVRDLAGNVATRDVPVSVGSW